MIRLAAFFLSFMLPFASMAALTYDRELVDSLDRRLDKAKDTYDRIKRIKDNPGKRSPEHHAYMIQINLGLVANASLSFGINNVQEELFASRRKLVFSSAFGIHQFYGFSFGGFRRKGRVPGGEGLTYALQIEGDTEVNLHRFETKLPWVEKPVEGITPLMRTFELNSLDRNRIEEKGLLGGFTLSTSDGLEKIKRRELAIPIWFKSARSNANYNAYHAIQDVLNKIESLQTAIENAEEQNLDDTVLKQKLEKQVVVLERKVAWLWDKVKPY